MYRLSGRDSYEVPLGDQALSVSVEAIADNDPRTTNLWFDVTAVAAPKTTPERAELIVQRIRQLGIARILYGTDAPTGANLPRNGWAAFRALPLTEAEFQAIAQSIPPYMR